MPFPPKIIPFLRYDDAPAAIDWLCKAFGFEPRFVSAGEQPGTIDHAQLALGPELIMVASARGAARGVRGSETDARQGLYMFIPDIEAHHLRAQAHQVKITQPLRHQDYGSHEYSALDCEGHSWSFGTYRGEPGTKPEFKQLNLIARDMDATLSFYRALGLEIPEAAIWRTSSGTHHVGVNVGASTLDFDSPALAQAYNRGWQADAVAGPRSIASFHVHSREAVDALCEKLKRLGAPVSQPPFDAFWGARYAIVIDPEGNHVGIMSPSDGNRRSEPPAL